jgi:transcriptional regulator with XRE-family HTH domain
MTNLKKIREATALSQAKLAEASGVNVRMIQHYEQGSKDINAAAALTVYRLAQALDCTVEDLIEK